MRWPRSLVVGVLLGGLAATPSTAGCSCTGAPIVADVGVDGDRLLVLRETEDLISDWLIDDDAKLRIEAGCRAAGEYVLTGVAPDRAASPSPPTGLVGSWCGTTMATGSGGRSTGW